MSKLKNSWNKVGIQSKKIQPEIDDKIWRNIQSKYTSNRRINYTYWAAAVLIPLFGLVFLLKNNFSPQETSKTSQWIVYKSDNKSQKITLIDGSIIRMLPHSSLSVAQDFGKTNRNIKFTGKAYFNIAKDKTKAFTIDANEFTVKVLGTQFLLDQASEEKKVELFEGKVEINHQQTLTYLKPKEIWLRNKENHDIHYSTAEAVKTFDFQNESLSKAIQDIEKTYYVKITYPQSLKDKILQGSITGNLHEIIEIVGLPFNLKTSINDRTILLK